MKTITTSLLLLLILPFGAAAQTLTEPVTTFILVRHAEKADSSENPDLSNEGYERVSRLQNMLEEIEFEAVYSTPFLRTTKTAHPIAERHNLDIQEYDYSNPEGLTARWKEEHEGQNILIVGHSNTTPSFANALLEREHFKEKFDESDFGNILIVTISADGASHLLHLKF